MEGGKRGKDGVEGWVLDEGYMGGCEREPATSVERAERSLQGESQMFRQRATQEFID